MVRLGLVQRRWPLCATVWELRTTAPHVWLLVQRARDGGSAPLRVITGLRHHPVPAVSRFFQGGHGESRYNAPTAGAVDALSGFTSWWYPLSPPPGASE